MRALVGCERSGAVRNALREVGVLAYSSDIEAAEDGSEYHMQGDFLEVLEEHGDAQHLVIVHPECRYLSASGLHWNKRRPERAQETEKALAFVAELLKWAIQHPNVAFCLENPHGCIGTRLPDLDRYFVKQTIQPYDFGDDASKATVLRLLGLPKLTPTKRVPGRWVTCNGKLVERWSNQTDSGQNRLGPSDTRSMDRARTYPGIALAMATQWSVRSQQPAEATA